MIIYVFSFFIYICIVCLFVKYCFTVPLSSILNNALIIKLLKVDKHFPPILTVNIYIVVILSHNINIAQLIGSCP